MTLFSLPMAPAMVLVVGAAAFLPTTSTACLERTPAALQGRAMAACSECWGISAVVAPPVAGETLPSSRAWLNGDQQCGWGDLNSHGIAATST